jgi:exodeoxyribonuclease V gamma subunit
LILSARQQLIITYIGQSLAQNQSIPPSVVISELLEVLSSDYQLHDIVVKQPLQPFSQNYFNGVDKQLFSYSQADYETALALKSAKPEPSVWWQGVIPAENAQLLELAELFAFYRHPQRYFLRRQLDLRLQTLQADPEEREPFAIDGLESYAISHDWIEALLTGDDFKVAKLQAQGRWLAGVMGELEFIRQENGIIEFVSKINALKLGEKRADQAIDLNAGDYRLIGKLGNLYENGSLFYRCAMLKGKDLLQALLQHSVMNQIQPHCTYVLSLDELLVLTPDLGSAELLNELLAMYVKGLQRPDTLFSDSVLDYVRQAHTLNTSDRANKPALQVAVDTLKRSLEQDYEPELQRLYGTVTDVSELLNDDLVDFCEDVILPVWAATHHERCG